MSDNPERDLVDAMAKTYQGVWRNTIRRSAAMDKVNGYDDYMKLCGTHDQLRKANVPYKDTVRSYAAQRAAVKGRKEPKLSTIKKRNGILNEFSGVHHGLVEQKRYQGFKNLLDIQVADKETKKSIINHSKELAARYDKIGEALKSPKVDRKTSLKALKHLHMRLDPRSTTSTATAQSWLIARNKPNGDKSLRFTMQSLAKSREIAHREAFGALARSSQPRSQSQ
jgi:hypothetical protein